MALAALCPTIAISGPAQTTSDAGTPPTFYIGPNPFKFVGGFLPGWHWGYGDEAADLDQIQSARATGITVMHLMLPQFEKDLGVYNETMLARLDRYLDNAYKNNMYVMISFIQAYSETSDPNTGSPYIYPTGIDGIIKDATLYNAFRNRVAKLVNRQNTVNDRYYRDDATILAWIVCDEPVSAPFNYCGGTCKPQVTVDELADWFKETASYIKSLDPNHLVSVYAQPAIQGFFGGTPETQFNYEKALSIPEFDFIYMEDAGLDVLTNTVGYNCGDHNPSFDNQQFHTGKPVVFLPAFSSSCWDPSICYDYTLQGNDLYEATGTFFDMGATAALIQNWGSELYSSIPWFDRCFVYTDSVTYTAVTEKLLARSQAVNPGGYPTGPLQFVTVPAITPRHTLNVVNKGGGGVSSSGLEIDCGATCYAAFLQGTTVTLTAEPAWGFRVSSWSGCFSANGTVCTVNITGTTTVILTFTNAPPPGPAPIISTISPTSGAAGAAVTIAGKNFGATQSSSSATFNGTTALVTSWSDTKIVCKVPAGAATGPVVVTTDTGGSSNGKTFTVKPPLVSGLSPSSGAMGINVTISGSSFGVARGLSTVTFGGVEATVDTWTSTKITCKVPSGISPGSPVPVVVTVSAVNSNATRTFTVKPPLVSGVSPSSGAIGATVTISGNYFGPSQGSSTVTFSGATITPNTWTNTKITCTVPAGTKTGPVVVTTEAGSNAVLKIFTVKAPVLTSISPLHGQIQDTITLSGSYFGTTQGESRVQFPNDKVGDITSWSNTKITCKVPFGTWTGPVTVITDGGTSKEKWHTVDPPPPP